MKKKYGVSKRIGKIRRGLKERFDAYAAAYESGDAEAYDRLYREYYAYVCRYQKELGIPDERVEDLRQRVARSDKTIAEIKYIEEKLKRLKRELDEQDRELDKALLAEEKRGKIKWQ